MTYQADFTKEMSMKCVYAYAHIQYTCNCSNVQWVKDILAHFRAEINISEESKCGVTSGLSLFSEAEVNSIFWRFPRNSISKNVVPEY